MNFKKIGKNILAFLLGGVAGVVVSAIYVLKLWLPSSAPDIGLGVIALIPAVLIIYGFFGFFVGGIFGIATYQVARRIKNTCAKS